MARSFLLDFEGQDAVSHRKSLPGAGRGQGIVSMQKWGFIRGADNFGPFMHG